MAGYSGTPLAKKLGIRDGHRVAAVDAPPGFTALLDLGPSVRLESTVDEARAFDVVVAFVPELAALAPALDRCVEAITWSGGLWLAWPKQKSPLVSDVRESDIRREGLATGLVDNKICAIDEDWSGLRFVVRVEDRPKG